MKTPDAGARFGLSWSCAVAGRGVSLFLPRVFNPSGVPKYVSELLNDEPTALT
jgi:hypothetical protein